MDFLIFLGIVFFGILPLAITILGVALYHESKDGFIWEEYDCNPKYNKAANLIMFSGLYYLNFFGKTGWYIGWFLTKILRAIFLSKDGEDPCD
ncbi:MAG: hypothetical protein KAS32_09810 [Candidatus Peribacteraceae bacterium]|nr:hypothetical protein [Candidatus Peribacteraceae bacterium]